MMLVYHIPITGRIIAVPGLLVAAAVHGARRSASGSRRSTSATATSGYALPFLTQFWLFATPVAYPSTLVPSAPPARSSASTRWPASSRAFAGRCSAAPRARRDARWSRSRSSSLLLVGGLCYFRRMERTFADVV